MKQELLDKNKLLTYLYDKNNEEVQLMSEAKDFNIEFVIASTIRSVLLELAQLIEKGRFNA